jgi:hypothetical protein
MDRYAQTYRAVMCRKCLGHMVTHVLVDGSWRVGCSMCKTELDPQTVRDAEAAEWYKPLPRLVGRRGIVDGRR